MTYNKNMDFSEHIDRWASLINESSSVLLDNIAEDFGTEVVFNVKVKIKVNDKLALDIFRSLNKNFFEGKLKEIPISYRSFSEIVEELRNRGSVGKINRFIGVHSVLLQNDIKDIREDTELTLTDNIIRINSDEVNNRSFIFNVSTICHEMIHYYDSMFGEYPDVIKSEYLLNKHVDPHDTNTFKHYMKMANNNNLNVIRGLYDDNIDTIDYETMKLMLSSLNEDDNDISNKTILSTSHFSMVNPHLAVINVFD